MDPLSKAEHSVFASWASSANVELLFLSDLEKWGQEEGIKCEPGPVKGIAGEDELDQKRVVTISYTSGTTGESIPPRCGREGTTLNRLQAIPRAWYSPMKT